MSDNRPSRILRAAEALHEKLAGTPRLVTVSCDEKEGVIYVYFERRPPDLELRRFRNYPVQFRDVRELLRKPAARTRTDASHHSEN